MYAYQKKKRLVFCWIALAGGILLIVGAVALHFGSEAPKGYIATTGTVVATIPPNNSSCFTNNPNTKCSSVIQFVTSNGEKKTYTQNSAFGNGTLLNIAYDSSNPTKAKTLVSPKMVPILMVPGIALIVGGGIYLLVLRRVIATS
jgi:hypothetical protein